MRAMASNDSRRGFLKAGVAATVAAGTTLAKSVLADAPPPAKEKVGTLLRAPDGKLYFVPDDALAPFVVDDKRRTALEDRFGEGLKASIVNLPGKNVAEAGVNAAGTQNVLLCNLAALRTSVVAITSKFIPAPAVREAPTPKK
jgi:hypothetical protein